MQEYCFAVRMELCTFGHIPSLHQRVPPRRQKRVLSFWTTQHYMITQRLSTAFHWPVMQMDMLLALPPRQMIAA